MTRSWACNVQHMPRVLDRTLFVATDAAAYEEMRAFANSSGLPLHVHLYPFKSKESLRYGNMSYYW